ncbi:putative DNA double-strand break repair Rad50 ATPase [Gossypium australe]|uniref:Putative DNA double-strand break repair Rad50 ATPase n=1 Tax=Gossypium australe TaxID=47621 RepID=A0A5B6VMU4_9ROSI|nr:putative DNA double-strand break repair Rad50 ATPase [Gossypium australe]
MQDQMQERLTKIQQDMIEQIQESQNNMINLLAQLLAKEREKEKGIAASSGNDNDGPALTPPNTQTPLDVYPQRASVTIRPQYQAGTAIPTHHPTGSGTNSGTNPGESPANPVVPDFDEMAEMDKAKVDLPRQFEDHCKWLEEKFKEMETANYRYGVDAKDLSLVPDLVLLPKFKTSEFEKYNGTSCPEVYITMFYDGWRDTLAGSAAKWYNQLSRAQIKTWKDMAQAFMKHYGHVADIAPDRITL